MNRRYRYSNFFLVTALVTSLISLETPLWASPQSSQSSSAQSSATGSGSNAPPEAPQPQPAQAQQQSTQTPSGAAGAPGANPKGSPVAQPAGAAVAPAKQRGHRSLLIKVGLLVGGAVAVGTVVALSEKSPTRPPGTATSNHP